MYTGLLHIHSFFRWVIIILLFVLVAKSFINRHKPFEAIQRKLALILLIITDSTLLVGVYQWFTGPFGLHNIKQSSMKEVMKDSVSRFFAVEHFIGMLIAIILIHIGYSYSKKDISNEVKHKRTFIFFVLALIVILISIPWPFRQVGMGRGWF